MTPDREKPAPSLTTTRFLFAVGVLIVNDLVLKHATPGVVTGKLSDIAGLFAAPFLGSADPIGDLL